MSIEDDIELVRRVLDREPAAQDEFVHRSESIFKGVAIGRYRLHRDQVDDLYQKFILSLIENEYRKLCQWSRESPLDAYLRTIAKNQCKDHFRSMRRQNEREVIHEDDEDPIPALRDEHPGPFATVNVYEQLDCVMRAMERLQERDQLLIKRKSEGYSYRDIADELGMTVTNVGVARTRALKRLQLEVQHLCPEYVDSNEL